MKIYPAIEGEKRAEDSHVYIVKSSDSLCKTYRMYLCDGSRYLEIKFLNGLTSNIIHAWQKLKSPVSAYLKVGDKVKVTASRYATREAMSNWVRERTHTV